MTIKVEGGAHFPRYSAPLISSAQKTYDVAVIGAGPAGCSAAAALAQQGLSVLLLEKATLPRYKTCGGGLLRRARKTLPDSVADVVEREFRSITLNVLGQGRSIVATRSEPLVSMTMRAGFDHLLARHACQLGAELRAECVVKRVTPVENGVEILTGRGTFRSRFVIAADGVHSPIAKANGWSPLPCLAPALEWEVHLSAEAFAHFGQTARFDFAGIDSGYAWVFPKRDHLSVGILSTRRTCADLPARLDKYLTELGLNRIVKCEKHGYLIPLAPRREPLGRGRILLVGDAAGLADPVTAEGISYALLSGQLAAEAIVQGRADDSEVAERYQTLLEKNILRDLRAGRFLAHMLYRFPRVRDLAFRWQGRRLAEFVADVVMGERGYAVALASPASYLKMLGFGKGRRG